MSNSLVGLLAFSAERRHARWVMRLIAFLAAVTGLPAFAAISCERTVTANVVAIDQPIMFNRLGAANINGMMYALRRDVIRKGAAEVTEPPATLVAGQVQLRPDKRPRPLVLRVRVGDCMTVNLENLLADLPNPNKAPIAGVPPFFCPVNQLTGLPQCVDGQTQTRHVGFSVSGMQLFGSIADDGANVGANGDHTTSLTARTKSYTLYAEKEGVFLITNNASTIGHDANQGNSGNGLFGQVIVEPRGAKIYRSILTEEEMRLAADKNGDGILSFTLGETTNADPKLAHPVINYEATYPATDLGGNRTVWAKEGKGGLPIINMMMPSLTVPGAVPGVEIVHSELEAMIVGPGDDGTWKQACTTVGDPACPYPLERAGQRNPTIPNRLEPFRDLAQVWHDEPNTAQAFPGFYNDPVWKYVLAGVKDGFMINYGSGGIGSEIIANRLGVGPMHDCLSCSYEEFFLTSFTVGDPALLVDFPANVGLEACTPAMAAAGECLAVGPKAGKALFPADPINVHHAYIGDFIKFRNTHIGKEQHVFHLHNHQWLYNPNDDNANYLDAQGVGPGIGYTYEINFGGSGNRNKSAGDAIFHCHFYPHFAQGMWYHLRNYDTFEAGTKLVESGGGYHATAFALRTGTPAPGSRAHPDGELEKGVPLVAIVPLPGKPLAPIPADVEIVANPLTKPSGLNAAVQVPVGSVAVVKDRKKNPGYPFWIAGIDAGAAFDAARATATPAELAELNMSVVGQRPPTPVLDMLKPEQAAALVAETAALQDGDPMKGLFSTLVPGQAGGHDGGLPRHALRGVVAGGAVHKLAVTPRDFTKTLGAAVPVFYPEGGTELERLAMAFHKQGKHATGRLMPDGSYQAAADFITNGVGPVVGAPYHEPCRDDNTGLRNLDGTPKGHLTAGVVGEFFGAVGLSTKGSSNFNASNPRVYKGVNIQFDAILNKVGYHYPQQRIIALWEDAVPVIEKRQPPEPLVMRLNTFDCAVYWHANLVPEYFEMDDYQVRTPTDIIGQHIHLPKWDLTTTDGAANGWNYEDGTLSPGAVRERIHAINEANLERVCHGKAAIVPDAFAAIGYGARTVNVTHTCPGLPPQPQVTVPDLVALPHPFFKDFGIGLTPTETGPLWHGARTTMQRWFADPVVNVHGVDRGLGIIFTHDHYGPSTHQQIGLYATVLAQPAGSTWMHNEKQLVQLGQGPNGPTDGGRHDGGPTSWQARILPPTAEVPGNTTKSHTVEPFREFYLEFSDFQHAYERGVYVGANGLGVPIEPLGTFPDDGIVVPPENGQNPRINRVLGVPGGLADSFRFAINPPAREQIAPLYPDLVLELAGGTPFCPARPCPQAIDVQDPGMFAVNYRNEPVGLRVFDPDKIGPDGRKGTQATGFEGDLAFALTSQLMDKNGGWTENGVWKSGPKPIQRKIPELNMTEQQLIVAGILPPQWTLLNNPGAKTGGDPFTPMMRAYQGDKVRVKIQAGGHEEEHNATILGMKWLQGGSGFGSQKNSGWRNAQAAGISEQFTLEIPIVQPVGTVKGTRDYLYNVDSSMDGWWSGSWGLMRTYDALTDLAPLRGNEDPTPGRVTNRTEFNGVCPKTAFVRNVEVVAILANDLGTHPGVTITPAFPGTALPGFVSTQHVGGALKDTGGTLVYNPRGINVGDKATFNGPLHDPTAMLYVRVEDLEPQKLPATAACKDGKNQPGVANAQCAVKLKRNAEPLVLRANAGDCVNLVVWNRLPATAPDLPTLATLIGAVKRDFRHNDPNAPLDGTTVFDTNLIRPSSHVGITPQLVSVDVQSFLGTNVGTNVTQTVPPVDATTGKTGRGQFTWYVGDLNAVRSGKTARTMVPTPVEFGGFGLSPADKVKQGQKSLVGGMVVVPQGATIAEDAVTTGAPTTTRAQATIKPVPSDPTKDYRDFMMVMTKNLNQRYKDGSAVGHMNGEGVGIPEDSQESSNMAINYGIEPLWFRFGIPPQSPFGLGGYDVAGAERAYANELAGGDPATPVFVANKGKEARIHSAVPHGTSRGTTWTFYGHVWQRDPYVCPGETRIPGLPGLCEMTSVGSLGIGKNPVGFAQGAQESNTPMSHFTFRFESAGGGNDITGDYLFRDSGSFGNASGLWGLIRVQ